MPCHESAVLESRLGAMVELQIWFGFGEVMVMARGGQGRVTPVVLSGRGCKAHCGCCT